MRHLQQLLSLARRPGRQLRDDRLRRAEPRARAGRAAGHPTGTDLASLELETTAAAALAFTLQNYGAYVVDDTAWAVYALCVELGPDGDFTQQFQSDWGFSMTPSSKNTAWARDMDRLFGALAVVDNNAPSTIGGGGTPLQPPPPPLAL